MTTRERLELLNQLIARQLGSPAAQGNRLPLGRCACHEPTVRWCTRHGRPLKQRGT